jgi:hypothetical protein
MSNANIYYGASETVPKGKKRPTMPQAVDSGQVRYFGIKKVDQLLVAAKNDKKTENGEKAKKKKIDTLTADYVKLSGKVFRLTNNLKSAKTEAEKKEIQKEIKQLKLDIANKNQELKEAQK